MRCRLLALVVCASPLWAQADLFRDWSPPPGEARTPGKVACASLRALTGYDFSVISAEARPASASAPEFCRVMAMVQPEVRLEVALPAAWNGRLVMIGNGGYAGENLEHPGRIAARDSALRKGFAFSQTNTGHDAELEPLGTFAASAQKLLDYAFRAVHVTALTAKALSAHFYGRAPRRSYFLGCSTGGRQALMSAQRFPEDFDGILSMAPVLDFTGTMLKYAGTLQAFATAPVSEAKLKLAGETIYASCDAKDGVKDGILEDPRRCAFDPAAQLPKCPGAEAPDCFTQGQISGLTALYTDQVVNGKRIFPGWPVGPEAVGQNGRVGWFPWLVREGEPSLSQQFSTAFFQYLAFPKKNPDFQLGQLDIARDLPRLDAIRRTLDATDSDLSGFRDRQGKLLMTFGWADPALNPNMGVEYYESVVRKMGPDTRDFFRLFMMPGVFHCGGGPGCDSADTLSALVNWVENGKAPETMRAEKRQGAAVLRSRTLCPYPAVAAYTGTGSTDDAASFRCVASR